MAKILKTAEESIKDWKIEVTCTDNKIKMKHSTPCYYLIEVNSSDILKIKDYNYIGDVYYYGFICPNCGRFARIDDKYIPDYIKAKAKNYDQLDIVRG